MIKLVLIAGMLTPVGYRYEPMPFDRRGYEAPIDSMRRLRYEREDRERHRETIRELRRQREAETSDED